jgi:hypothetical protein
MAQKPLDIRGDTLKRRVSRDFVSILRTDKEEISGLEVVSYEKLKGICFCVLSSWFDTSCFQSRGLLAYSGS